MDENGWKPLSVCVRCDAALQFAKWREEEEEEEEEEREKERERIDLAPCTAAGFCYILCFFFFSLAEDCTI